MSASLHGCPAAVNHNGFPLSPACPACGGAGLACPECGIGYGPDPAIEPDDLRSYLRQEIAAYRDLGTEAGELVAAHLGEMLAEAECYANEPGDRLTAGQFADRRDAHLDALEARAAFEDWAARRDAVPAAWVLSPN